MGIDCANIDPAKDRHTYTRKSWQSSILLSQPSCVVCLYHPAQLEREDMKLREEMVRLGSTEVDTVLPFKRENL